MNTAREHGSTHGSARNITRGSSRKQLLQSSQSSDNEQLPAAHDVSTLTVEGEEQKGDSEAHLTGDPQGGHGGSRFAGEEASDRGLHMEGSQQSMEHHTLSVEDDAVDVVIEGSGDEGAPLMNGDAAGEEEQKGESPLLQPLIDFVPGKHNVLKPTFADAKHPLNPTVPRGRQRAEERRRKKRRQHLPKNKCLRGVVLAFDAVLRSNSQRKVVFFIIGYGLFIPQLILWQLWQTPLVIYLFVGIGFFLGALVGFIRSVRREKARRKEYDAWMQYLRDKGMIDEDVQDYESWLIREEYNESTDSELDEREARRARLKRDFRRKIKERRQFVEEAAARRRSQVRLQKLEKRSFCYHLCANTWRIVSTFCIECCKGTRGKYKMEYVWGWRFSMHDILPLALLGMMNGFYISMGVGPTIGVRNSDDNIMVQMAMAVSMIALVSSGVFLEVLYVLASHPPNTDIFIGLEYLRSCSLGLFYASGLAGYLSLVYLLVGFMLGAFLSFASENPGVAAILVLVCVVCCIATPVIIIKRMSSRLKDADVGVVASMDVKVFSDEERGELTGEYYRKNEEIKVDIQAHRVRAKDVDTEEAYSNLGNTLRALTEEKNADKRFEVSGVQTATGVAKRISQVISEAQAKKAMIEAQKEREEKVEDNSRQLASLVSTLRFGELGLTRKHLEEGGVNPNVVVDHMPLLCHAALGRNSAAAVRLLLDFGATPGVYLESLHTRYPYGENLLPQLEKPMLKKLRQRMKLWEKEQREKRREEHARAEESRKKWQEKKEKERQDAEATRARNLMRERKQMLAEDKPGINAWYDERVEMERRMAETQRMIAEREEEERKQKEAEAKADQPSQHSDSAHSDASDDSDADDDGLGSVTESTEEPPSSHESLNSGLSDDSDGEALENVLTEDALEEMMKELVEDNAFCLAAVHFAARCGDAEALKALIAGGADVNIPTLREHRTALHLAIANARPTAVNVLLSTPGIDLYATTRSGFSIEDYVDKLEVEGPHEVQGELDMTPKQQLRLDLVLITMRAALAGEDWRQKASAFTAKYLEQQGVRPPPKGPKLFDPAKAGLVEAASTASHHSQEVPKEATVVRVASPSAASARLSSDGSSEAKHGSQASEETVSAAPAQGSQREEMEEETKEGNRLSEAVEDARPATGRDEGEEGMEEEKGIDE